MLKMKMHGCLLSLVFGTLMVSGCREPVAEQSSVTQTDLPAAEPDWSAGESGEADSAEGESAALAELQGVWIIEDAQYHGAEIAGMKGLRAEIKDDTVSIGAPGEGVVSTMRLDTDNDPAWMDTTGTGGTTQAIYKLEDDTLWICTGPPNGDSDRPTEFKTSPNSEAMLFQYRRTE